MSQLLLAFNLAFLAHQNQTDKSNNPYIYHPIRVMSSLHSEEEKIVAILHDVVEDTEVSINDIKFLFGETISEAVDAITHRKHEPREEYYTRVKNNEIALQVKLADIEDNLSPERLWELDEETRERLTKKYTKALEFLIDTK